MACCVKVAFLFFTSVSAFLCILAVQFHQSRVNCEVLTLHHGVILGLAAPISTLNAGSIGQGERKY